MGTYDLPDEELLEEESRPVRERILVALRLEGATNKQLQQITGATEGTVRNKLAELRANGLITDDGKRPATYNLASSSSEHPRGSDGDDTSSPSTVAELFASPPSWLVKQLDVYRGDPERHIEPLCSAVAAAALGDGAGGDAVRAEVEKELERWK